MSTTTRALLGAAALVAIAGCGSATTTAASLPGVTATPSTPSATAAPPVTTPPTATPSPIPVPAPATVMTAAVSGHGTVLIAANGRTLYMFASDRVGSGMSACTGGCSAEWPPLTVAQGSVPSPTPGVSGQLGTITRADGRGMQVTYNGHPLYFYSGDSGPAQTHGNYPGWSVVTA